jgi:hypothetical protein
LAHMIKRSHDGLGFMMFNATFNNISAISWQSVLLLEEIEVPRENHRFAESYMTLWHHLVFIVATINFWFNKTKGSCELLSSLCICPWPLLAFRISHTQNYGKVFFLSELYIYMTLRQSQDFPYYWKYIFF